MCGYIGNLHESPVVIDLFNQLQLPLPLPHGQYYMMQMCDGLITETVDSRYQRSPAMWWYAMKWQDGKLVPNQKITSFNARNLDGKMWYRPINERRGILFATEIGETQGRKHYLMKAKQPLVMGTLYQDWKTPTGIERSFALITRKAHPRFARYHEKAMPLFLPFNVDVLKTWLNPRVPADDYRISSLLDHPRLTADFEVTPVKTFKRGEPVGDTELLPANP